MIWKQTTTWRRRRGSRRGTRRERRKRNKRRGKRRRRRKKRRGRGRRRRRRRKKRRRRRKEEEEEEEGKEEEEEEEERCDTDMKGQSWEVHSWKKKAKSGTPTYHLDFSSGFLLDSAGIQFDVISICCFLFSYLEASPKRVLHSAQEGTTTGKFQLAASMVLSEFISTRCLSTPWFNNVLLHICFYFLFIILSFTFACKYLVNCSLRTKSMAIIGDIPDQ